MPKFRIGVTGTVKAYTTIIVEAETADTAFDKAVPLLYRHDFEIVDGFKWNAVDYVEEWDETNA